MSLCILVYVYHFNNFVTVEKCTDRCMDNVIFVVILNYIRLICFLQAYNFQSVYLLNSINNVMADFKVRNGKQYVTVKIVLFKIGPIGIL